MKQITTQCKIEEFIRESNAIEREYSEQAFKDAVRAWTYLKVKLFLTPEVILATHNFLMRNMYPEIAGKWRNCDVWIGGQRKFFVSETLIKDDVKAFCSQVWGITCVTNKSDDVIKIKNKDKEDHVKKTHIAFEHLHPFVDGNGRIGRLIYLWHREQLGLPIHIIHADIEDGGDEQISYYRWFQESLDK